MAKEQLHPRYTNKQVLAGLAITKLAFETGLLNKENFSMPNVCDPAANACGTIGCIGGWTGLFMGLSRSKAIEFVGRTRKTTAPYLYELFFDWPGERATPAWAAKRIEQFLNDHGR